MILPKKNGKIFKDMWVLSLKEIQYLYDLIQKLNPRRFSLSLPEKTEIYSVPDIILEKEVDG